MGSLRHFIKDVRNASTPSKEREIISKETAKIRTRLRNDQLDIEKRRVYIQKLLYLYVMGQKTQFGQIDCINLIASDNYVNKRLGYLSAILLLKDENSELLTLLTNMISQDLQHKNQYIVSMALHALGSLCDAELGRDLFPDVINLINKNGSTNPYILKQCLTVSTSIIRKDANLIQQFTMVRNGGLISELFATYYGSSSKNTKKLHTSKPLSSSLTNGLLLSLLEFIRSCFYSGKKYDIDDDFDEIMLINIVQPLTSQLITILQNQNSQSEFSDSNDPFLQVSLIQTLKIIFTEYANNFSSSDSDLKDFKYLLTKIINSNNNNSTNSKSAAKKSLSVKYEAIKTILELPVFEISLKSLAVNVLLKFLSSKDSNHKYVALNTLVYGIKYLKELDSTHLRNIFQCLYEADSSIKQRALNLVFEILSNKNIIEPDFVIDDLMQFLSQCNENDKSSILYTIDQLLDLDIFNKNEKNLDNLVYCIKYGGKYLTQQQINDIIITINNNSFISSSSATCQFFPKLFQLSINTYLNKTDQQDYFFVYNNYALKLITVWCLGEYGDMVLSSKNTIVDESTIIKYLLEISTEFYDYGSSSESCTMINYLLTTVLKLSIKFQSKSQIENLRLLLLNYTKENDNLIIKLKSCQYLVLFEQPNTVKRQFLDNMPIFDTQETSNGKFDTRDTVAKSHKQTDLLADLLEDMDTNTNETSAQNRSQPSIAIPLQAELLYSNDRIEILTDHCISDNGLGSHNVSMSLYVRLKPSFSNEICEKVQLFIAVSKTQKVSIGHLSNNTLSSADPVIEQKLKVQGTGLMKTRIKIQYEIENFPYVEQFDHVFEKIVL